MSASERALKKRRQLSDSFNSSIQQAAPPRSNNLPIIDCPFKVKFSYKLYTLNDVLIPGTSGELEAGSFKPTAKIPFDGIDVYMFPMNVCIPEPNQVAARIQEELDKVADSV